MEYSVLEPRSSFKERSFWFYAPNKPAPIVFAFLFLVSGLFHGYQCWRYKSWKITGLLSWSATLFITGFIIRAVGAFGQWDNLRIFISSTVFLLVAPPAYESANCLILSRIFFYIPYHAPIHPGRVLTTFLTIAIAIEVITANGAANSANSENSPSKQKLGKNLCKAALILQLALMCGFIAITLRFYYSCWKAKLLNSKVKRSLNVLLISCALISTRTAYRVVEYFTAASLNIADTDQISPVLKQEWFFYVFEASVMFCNSAMFNFFHPRHALPESNKVYLAMDGVTEVHGPGYKDDRPFIVTFLDPFDILGMLTGRDKKNQYWEKGGDKPQTQQETV